jgi:chemotaxis protein histidine kinase CheA
MAHTPAVSNGKFSFVADNFFVESSGNHFHPRAPVSDLQVHFQPGNNKDKDYTAHWYEAQLLHYGLPPSKSKAVAKMRLLDAVNSGKLAVPKEILKIEADLKKEWKKKDKEARAEQIKQEETNSAPKNTTKRKREDPDDAGKPAAKTTKVKQEPKAKVTKSETKSTKTAENKSTKVTNVVDSKPKKASVSKSDGAAVASPPKKQTAKRGGAAVGQKKTTDTTEEKPKRTKQTARCSSRGRAAAVVSRNKKDEPVEEKPKRTKQTARCSSRGGGSISGKRKTPDTSETTLGIVSNNRPGYAPPFNNSEFDEMVRSAPCMFYDQIY